MPNPKGSLIQPAQEMCPMQYIHAKDDQPYSHQPVQSFFGEIKRERAERGANGWLTLRNCRCGSCSSFFFWKIAILTRLEPENELAFQVLFQREPVSAHA